MKKNSNIMVQRHNNNNFRKTSATTTTAAMEGLEWEMRPGGMLVQKRNINSYSSSLHNNHNKINSSSSPPSSTTALPNLTAARVKFNSCSSTNYYSQDTQTNPEFSTYSFGEGGDQLKKMQVVSGSVSLSPPQQHHYKIYQLDKDYLDNNYYNNNNNNSNSNSNINVNGSNSDGICYFPEDTTTLMSQDKNRLLQLRRNRAANTDGGAFKSVAEVTLEVDKLAIQVTKLEGVIGRGGTVSEKELLNLIELLMSQLIKLDGIEAYGDTKLTRKKQVIRVQEYMETLDRLKLRNGRQQHHQKQSLSNLGAENPIQMQRIHLYNY